MIQAINQRNKKTLASKVQAATKLHQRMIGLLGHSKLEAQEGLWISPCTSIHTFFMRFSIDALFLDAKHQVIHQVHHMKPFALSKCLWSAIGVLELPAGTLQKNETQLGDTISMEPLT